MMVIIGETVQMSSKDHPLDDFWPFNEPPLDEVELSLQRQRSLGQITAVEHIFALSHYYNEKKKTND